MRAFVTGATGFIGHRLVGSLRAARHHVSALIRGPARSQFEIDRAVIGDLSLGVDQLASAMRGADVVFHLAARISFDPRALPELMTVNAEGTRRVLEAAAIAKVNRTVVVSSACTLGLARSPREIRDESDGATEEQIARNPYLASKLAAESIAFRAVERGQDVVIVNPTTVFGAGDRTLNSGTLIRQVALGRFVPVPPGGSNVVDVDEVVDGILAAVTRGKSGRRYVLGGHNLTFSKILSSIADVVGRRPIFVPVHSPARLPMMAAAWCVSRLTGSRLITPQIVGDTFAFKYYSSARAVDELAWSARRPFVETLARAWDYYTDHGLITPAKGVAA